MIFKQIPVGPMDNFNYLIADQKAKIAAVIDPAFEENKLFSEAEKIGCYIKMILLTHTHFDHIEAVGRVLERTDATIYVHANEKHAIEKFTSNIKTIDEGDIIKIGDVEVKVLFTPGHTPGGVTYLLDKKLITGDALFVESCGRTDLPGGKSEILKKTLQRFASLPSDYEVYPGHNYGSCEHSTIGHEKEHNMFMK